MEAIDAEIIEKLKLLENGQLSVDQFEKWHIGRTWGKSSELITEIDFTLVEKSLLTKEQLISELLSHAKDGAIGPTSTASG
ncbi:MAG: hypothetical protein OXG34_00270 [bacterium]|nr:hypothetical protein [bacterium]MCY4136024.1 hypothetical protein [bacterium]